MLPSFLDCAEVHLATLVPVYTLQHTDALNQISHLKFYVIYRTGPDPGRLIEFLIVTEGDHTYYDEQKGGADSNADSELPTLEVAPFVAGLESTLQRVPGQPEGWTLNY